MNSSLTSEFAALPMLNYTDQNLQQLNASLPLTLEIFAHTYMLIACCYVDQCGYMIFPWENFMKRSAIISTLSLITLSLPAIVIERAIATYFSSRDENLATVSSLFFS
ncbi:hypothetical protein DINM_020220 [Dirofilaria immitis]|nr:hypothetical protein [Dirofilaria immitis]